MSDDDWDNDEELGIPPVVIPPVVATGGGNWDDEDAEDNVNVQDDWDASEDESAESKPASATASSGSAVAAPPKKKKGLKEAIAARKAEEEKKKLAAIEAAKRKEEEDALETPEERKRREEMSVRESDLQNAKDLFAGIADAPAPAASFLDTMKPKTKDEFESYKKQLVEKISTNEKATNYGQFVENLTRDLCVSLSVDDIKRISSALTVLANEKQKAAKPAAAAKKKGGKGIVAGVSAKSGVDMTNYAEDDYDEFDDFM
ncbi:Eukaryotic translation initiation factor 3 subunit J [Chytriomyces hyalinus]|nr:Eukaryotic translation initiation factor 3 subunit J [Chytriomyces hyalinus]